MRASSSLTTRDPLARVMDLGIEKHVAGAVFGLIIALLVHGAAAARVAFISVDLLAWTHQMRLAINDRLASTYDIDVEKPKPPEPVLAPKEEPKEEKAPPPPAPKTSAPPPPPPAAAQAGAVLTQQPDNTPVDFTNTFVTGTGDSYAGGVTQASGTSTTAVYDRNAQAGGVPGGTGTKPAPPAPPGVNHSRSASSASPSWSCPFPAEAESEQIEEMSVIVEVEVSADGRAMGAHFKKDPGFGFGRAAVQCALRERYIPALDVDGHPVRASQAFRVNFSRE